VRKKEKKANTLAAQKTHCVSLTKLSATQMPQGLRDLILAAAMVLHAFVAQLNALARAYNFMNECYIQK
jgi:hypothetical protein